MTVNNIKDEKIITLDKLNDLIEDLEFNVRQKKQLTILLAICFMLMI